MKEKLLYCAQKYWPILIYTVLVLVLFAANYKPGTFLIGWDNLMPEFNFPLNLSRSIFVGWQDYSVGLVMGHSNDIVHQLSLFALSWIFPISVLRYLWTFFMLFIGTVGTYYLFGFLFGKRTNETISETNSTEEQRRDSLFLNTKFLAFCAGLFYLCNLATLQTFYVPFEPYTAQFASLPFLLWASLAYLEKQNKKRLGLLSLVLLLSTPATYVPTLFLVYLGALGFLILGIFVKNPSIKLVLSALKLGLVIVVVNVFWLFPFLYFTLTHSPITLASKINQMSTETIFLQNKEFGSINQIMQLRGFWFNNIDPDINGNFTYMMQAWKNWVGNPFINSIGYFLFIIIAAGMYRSFKKKTSYTLPLFLVFLFVWTALALATIPFSAVNSFVRTSFPLLNEAFRFPYTKFSLLAGLLYALFFPLGIEEFVEFINRISEAVAEKTRTKILATSVLLPLILIILFVFPFFTGHLLYDKERIKIPKEYFQVFDYFNHQDPSARIADFPQDSFWGWSFYRWGYGGSGFLWYGIQQPILDRVFDVWSQSSENYYNEVSSALYAKDPKALDAVFQKYQASFILVDKNVINPFSPKSLFYSQLQTLLQTLPYVKKTASFGSIDIYRVELKTKPVNYISAAENIPTTSSYSWGEHDTAFQTMGTYDANSQARVLAPFRTLFSYKTPQESSYSVSEDAHTISISTKLTASSTSKTLTIPFYAKTEKIAPITLYGKTDSDGNYTIFMHISTPDISLNGEKIAGESVENPIFIIPNGSAEFPFVLNVNGITNFEIQKTTSYIGTTFLPLDQDTQLTISDKNNSGALTQHIGLATLAALPIFQEKTVDLPSQPKKGDIITVTIPKILDNYLGSDVSRDSFTKIPTCDRFRLGVTSFSENQDQKTGLDFDSKNATSCVSYYQSSLPHDIGYITLIQAQNLQGRGLHYWILNDDEQFSPVDTYLPSDKKTSTLAYILPPMEHYGRAYSFHFDNISIGPDEVKNSLNRFSVYPIPYSYLSALMFGIPSHATIDRSPVALHPNETLYIIPQVFGTNPTIILSQGYDIGWNAYITPKPKNVFQKALFEAFPMLFGKRVTTHLMISDWSNGWKLSAPLQNSQQIIIVYLPQYLVYGGFVLLFVIIDFVIDPLSPVTKRLQEKLAQRK